MIRQRSDSLETQHITYVLTNVNDIFQPRCKFCHIDQLGDSQLHPFPLLGSTRPLKAKPLSVALPEKLMAPVSATHPRPREPAGGPVL